MINHEELLKKITAEVVNNENEVLDLVNENNPERLEIKQGNLIPMMVKAIQELQAKLQGLTE